MHASCLLRVEEDTGVWTETHPYIARRKIQGAALTAGEHVSFNGWLAAGITNSFGSMWAFYVLVLRMFARIFLACVVDT
jgi:hypothetical protein